jgi:hypothetical protein
MAAQVDVRMLPLLDGGWSEALRQQCFADPYLCAKFLNEPLERRLPKAQVWQGRAITARRKNSATHAWPASTPYEVARTTDEAIEVLRSWGAVRITGKSRVA